MWIILGSVPPASAQGGPACGGVAATTRLDGGEGADQVLGEGGTDRCTGQLILSCE